MCSIRCCMKLLLCCCLPFLTTGIENPQHCMHSSMDFDSSVFCGANLDSGLDICANNGQHDDDSFDKNIRESNASAHSSLLSKVMSVTLVNSLLKKITMFTWPTIYGLIILWFSWLLIYFDSKVPGVYPPSPISPKKRGMASGSTFQLSYAIGFVNGFIAFCFSLWQQQVFN